MEAQVDDRSVNDHPERRAADDIIAAVWPVIDIAVPVIIYSIVPYPDIPWRESPHAVAEIVRTVAPEVIYPVARHEVPLARMYPVDIVSVHPAVIVVTVVVAAAAGIAVVTVRRTVIPVILALVILAYRAETTSGHIVVARQLLKVMDIEVISHGPVNEGGSPERPAVELLSSGDTESLRKMFDRIEF